MQNKTPSSWIPRIFKEAESLDSTAITTEVETTRPLIPGAGQPQYQSSSSATRPIRWARILTSGVIVTLLIIFAAAYLLSHIIDNQKPRSTSTVATCLLYTSPSPRDRQKS